MSAKLIIVRLIIALHNNIARQQTNFSSHVHRIPTDIVDFTKVIVMKWLVQEQCHLVIRNSNNCTLFIFVEVIATRSNDNILTNFPCDWF